MTDVQFPFIDSSAHRVGRLLRSMGRKALGTCLATGIVTAGLGSGAAFAYFTHAGGSGTGTATTGSLKEITVTKHDVSGLFPGGTGSLVITLKNPYSSSALTVLGIRAGTGSIQVTGGSGCTATNSGVSVNTAASFSPSTVAEAPLTLTTASLP